MTDKLKYDSIIVKFAISLVVTFAVFVLYNILSVSILAIGILVILTIIINIFLSKYSWEKYVFSSSVVYLIITLIFLVILPNVKLTDMRQLFFTIFWFSLLEVVLGLLFILRRYIFNNKNYTANNKYVIFVSLLIPYIFFGGMILLVTLILLITNFNL